MEDKLRKNGKLIFADLKIQESIDAWPTLHSLLALFENAHGYIQHISPCRCVLAASFPIFMCIWYCVLLQHVSVATAR